MNLRGTGSGKGGARRSAAGACCWSRFGRHWRKGRGEDGGGLFGGKRCNSYKSVGLLDCVVDTCHETGEWWQQPTRFRCGTVHDGSSLSDSVMMERLGLAPAAPAVTFFDM